MLESFLPVGKEVILRKIRNLFALVVFIENEDSGVKIMKKIAMKMFGLLVLLSMLASPTMAQTEDTDPRLKGLEAGEMETVKATLLESMPRTDSYIVLLEDSSLISYRGDVAGYPATNPELTDQEFTVESSNSMRYLKYLRGKQDGFISFAETKLERKLEIIHRYDVILNGFAAKMSFEEAQQLAAFDGVRAVLPDDVWQPTTDVSPEFLGVDQLWEDTDSTPGALKTDGEGMLVGILDTGINMDHPSFAAVGGDGFVHTNPFGTEYKGLCASDPTNYVCNDKLVGVYAYTQADEAVFGEDNNSHGSHTASTTAGNYLPDLDFNGITVTISGMAPHANIIAYDVCHASGCPNAYSVAAVQQAVIDGVDVLNYSIGPTSPVNPYNNAVELAMLEAVSAGILTSTSAGNDGPDPSTVYKAPAWNLNVGNSTHGRIFGFPVKVYEPGSLTPYEAVALPGTGRLFTEDLVDKPIRWSGDDVLANYEGCAEFSTDFFEGSVALISRGTCSFAVKIANAANAGAEGVLIYNNSGGPPIVMGGSEATTIPSAMIDKVDGEAIVAMMSSTLQTTILSGQVAGTKAIWADIIAQGSSRGPYQLLDILTPDVTAPGTNILAAYATSGAAAPFGGIGSVAEIDLMSGTSMASPHGAGAALLLKDLFPTWSPIEIKSALMMSAYKDSMVKEDGITPADPFDVGNGRIDLTKAALIGLVMDETVANFTAANPAEGGDVKTLNLPSYQNSQCVGLCSFSRTVRNVAGVDTDYVVKVEAPLGVEITPTPAAFTLAPGATQSVQFDVDVMDAEIGEWQFAWITFDTEDAFSTGETITDARFPIAVFPDAGNLPSLVEKNVYRDAGGVLLEDLYSIDIPELTVTTAGLTEAELFEFELAGDPYNSDPYDNLDDVWFTTFTIPAGTKRVVMEVLETTASDLDLFFGYGPTPSASTVWDFAATGAALEYLSWTDPIAFDWWVLVQNWGGDSTPDDVTLALGLVPDVESTNFEVSGPSPISALEEFDLEITWDIPEMEPLSAWYGWFDVGSAPDSPGDIGETELNVYRPYDDVTKEVNVETTENGNVVTYTITIEPNRTGAALNYSLYDELPDGVTYVDGSLETTGSFTLAEYDAVNNAVTWTGMMPKIEFSYVASTPETNPDYCDTPFGGGYLDLKSIGALPIAGLAGDTISWSFTGLGTGQQYFGETISAGPTFTDDGYFYMGPRTVWWDWIPQEFPDPAEPNGIVAPWLYDMEIVYEAGVKGVSAAAWGSGALWAIQFDDTIEWDYPDAVMDYQVWSWRDLDPTEGWPDLVFAFDNVSDDWMPWGSIGLENYDGTVGTSFTFMDYIPASGDVICFDYTEAGANPVVITFDALVETDVETLITNTVLHEADGVGMQEEEAFAAFTNTPNIKPIADPQSLTTDEETPLDITLTGLWLEPGPVTYRVETDPTYGTLSGTAPDLVYTPFDDFYGLDSFTFVVNDGLEDSDPATISIEVININDSPYAVDDFYVVSQDGILDVPAPGVMENDIDPDPTDSTFVDLKEGPANGSLVLNEDGSFVYTPDPGFFGEDQFTYYFLGIPQRQEYIDEATVHITVTPYLKIYLPIFQ